MGTSQARTPQIFLRETLMKAFSAPDLHRRRTGNSLYLFMTHAHLRLHECFTGNTVLKINLKGIKIIRDRIETKDWIET